MSLASAHIDTAVQDGPPTLKTVVNFLLIFMTLPNYAAQKMKRGCGYPHGSRWGLLWLGGASWHSLCLTSHCVPSTPLACGQWAILGALQGPAQPFNPRPDLVSDWGVEEVRGVPHVSLLVTVSWMVSQPFTTWCNVDAEASVPYKISLIYSLNWLFII